MKNLNGSYLGGWTKPAPTSEAFKLSLNAYCVRYIHISEAEALGYASQNNAAIPATHGVAMLVPEIIL
jgi:hypothetical protein